ncbi:MAG TPA: type II toxin-antitoxin system RatA family toxin [Candidatus Competibacter sp.]|jgi:coenzyme Q-binding protein COQ10|nr:type II toxin-antitoxin system RatA family toxin [Candidatus Competibacter sp.]MCC9002647.1 type II toxin-antitoxin system RatA family toxin [Candidatus Competibacter sp.]HRF63331.1 type II toxin-antitoxin system RatA family toxin [Candidatus Competibacter sp.]HRX59931.1 type II toxin-antitoxin system RatA family toxin [Candidatus Competibacter sp.]HUM89765.1 type II toxin-antitoxin system RatA family toxin [Candidatus Competibacter sp.]
MFHKSHRESRVVATSVERMFDLVADVERYPEFLPLMRGATVVRRHANVYETEQILALGLLSYRLFTRTELDRPHTIVVTSADPNFRRFDIRWAFAPTPEGFCHTEFALDCEVRSLWLKPIGDALVLQMAAMMVNAFATRARRLESAAKSLPLR